MGCRLQLWLLLAFKKHNPFFLNLQLALQHLNFKLFFQERHLKLLVFLVSSLELSKLTVDHFFHFLFNFGLNEILNIIVDLLFETFFMVDELFAASFSKLSHLFFPEIE